MKNTMYLTKPALPSSVQFFLLAQNRYDGCHGRSHGHALLHLLKNVVGWDVLGETLGHASSVATLLAI